MQPLIQKLSFIILACLFLAAFTSQPKKINQSNKHHQKMGLWVETDTITASELQHSISRIDYGGDIGLSKIPHNRDVWWWDIPNSYVLTAKGEYNNGHRNGEWKYYIKDTVLIKKVFFTNDAIDSMFMFSSTKVLLLEGRTDWENDEFVYKKYGHKPGSGRFPIYFLNSAKNWNWIFE